MSLEFLDPTHEADLPDFSLAPRLRTIEGATVGLLSNGKKGTRPFFDALARELREQGGAAQIVRITKANFSAPAQPEIFDQAKEWDALVAGVGD
jgi:hypothetical protein